MRLAYSLVLSAAPGSDAVTEIAVAAARQAVNQDAVFEDRWLAPGEAWETLFSAEEPNDVAAIRSAFAASLEGLPIDVNVIPDDIAWRRKKLLVADMESTVVEQELLDEIAVRAGIGPRITDITARAMRGEIEFENSLKERVALLAGLDARILDEVYEQHATLMPGAETLFKTMKANGATGALVSGGFTVFTEKIAKRLGFDVHQANVLEIENGTLTGRVMEPILGRAAKRNALSRLADTLGIDPTLTLAVGDGANDLDMIGAAGLGVAFRAKPKVQAAARAIQNGAVITHGDLTALLYLQGYRREEFVA